MIDMGAVRSVDVVYTLDDAPHSILFDSAASGEALEAEAHRWVTEAFPGATFVRVSGTTQCKRCSRDATEANGLCFDDAEENAVLVYEAAIEFGSTPQQAREAAQRSWKA